MYSLVCYEVDDDEDGDGPPKVTNFGSRGRPVAGSMFCNI